MQRREHGLHRDINMAHFAQLKEQTDPTGFTNNTHLVVTYVMVVSNDVSTAAGPLGVNDMHVDGETWCTNFSGKNTTWKQTSYNHNFRKQYAGIGSIYDPIKDIFIRAQPFASWSIDANNDWQPPVKYPTITTYGEGEDRKGYFISWDEANLRWIAKDIATPPNSFNWDPSNLAWAPA